MKSKLSGRFWSALLLFGLIGQVAWVVENMYLNVFIYKIFSASASDISLMVASSAVSATLTTVFIGALSDRIGKRKLFICGGYILWGLSILSFSLIREDIIGKLFPMTVSAASVGLTLVIVMDCVMTFFGSSANDAAFNAWVTDSTSSSNRGAAEGVNSMMPLVAILAVFGGFMSFDLNMAESWSNIFIIIGAIVLAIGVFGIFLIKEPPMKTDNGSYIGTVFYGFSLKSFKENRSLYSCLIAFIVFNISIQIFMPYLIIYYEVSLKMTDYVFVMAPAIVLASAVTALWGRVYDKKGFKFTASFALIWLLLGYAFLYLFRSTALVFIGSLLMMSGYLAGTGVFGARIRDNTPEGKSGRLQGVRIFAQVLIPGIIGPLIGKAVLKNAETIIGNDGTESFIPSSDIFLAAAIPAILLFIFILILSKRRPDKTEILKTPYNVSDIPHDYHPRPSMRRDNFTVLNGKWNLKIFRHKNADYDGTVTVPFPPESELSGVKRVTKRCDVLVYSRKFNATLNGNHTILHFGASDNKTTVIVNGTKAGENIGGYLPFDFDITHLIHEGENEIIVKVTDRLDKTYPYGKQKYKRGGMWYTPVSGIWQTVWLEEVPENHIKNIKINTSQDHVTFKIIGGEDKKLLTIGEEKYSFIGNEITVEIANARFWTPESPHLYDFTIESGEDKIYSYFALRDIGIEKQGGVPYITLNGKPYFFHGLLDQGYFPDGIYMPPSEKGFEDDILRMKELGFNMLRKHIKIEPDIFYYYCDKYGMAVFQDMVNNGSYSFVYDTALPTIGLKNLPKYQRKKVREVFYSSAERTAELLYNHPSVICYTIFNEGWGQHDANAAYKRLKPLDPSRIWDTASGWFKTKHTDVESEHVYFKKANFKISSEKPTILSEFGGYSCNVEGHLFNKERVYGYKICKTQHELTRELEKLYLNEILPLVKCGLSAAVLTQLSDVEDETNGLLTYDRKVIKPDITAMKKIAEKIKGAFKEAPYNPKNF
ncbi:MAG: MFS transporter [Clostridia bacterium]|nr:MFS transporter [Clostridia bacterium]